MRRPSQALQVAARLASSPTWAWLCECSRQATEVSGLPDHHGRHHKVQASFAPRSEHGERRQRFASSASGQSWLRLRPCQHCTTDIDCTLLKARADTARRSAGLNRALERANQWAKCHKGFSSKRMFQDILIPFILDNDQTAGGKNALSRVACSDLSAPSRGFLCCLFDIAQLDPFLVDDGQLTAPEMEEIARHSEASPLFRTPPPGVLIRKNANFRSNGRPTSAFLQRTSPTRLVETAMHNAAPRPYGSPTRKLAISEANPASRRAIPTLVSQA